MPLLVLLLIGLLLVAGLALQPLLVERRRRRLRAQPFPAEWRAILRARVPGFRALPADVQLQLKRHVQVFLAEKRFVGCGGLAISDEIRVTIAAQACLLILNRRTDYYPRLHEILVYPAAFAAARPHAGEAGVLQEGRQVLLGESWASGQVILSWEDTRDGAAVADDGRNVVIHEFAHQLDQETGAANGAPRLPSRADYPRWSRVLGDEFARLQAQATAGEAGLLSHYGATDPAEFFAVASEVFFEQPQRLAAEHPALFRELGGLYRINPLSW